jgi:hypothetical protein
MVSSGFLGKNESLVPPLPSWSLLMKVLRAYLAGGSPSSKGRLFGNKA